MLELKFGESDYSIEEGSGILSSPIYLQFRNKQNPFKVMLSPVTVATAEEMGLGFFINSFTIAASSRATKGTQLYKNNCGTYSSYVLFSLTVPFLNELAQISSDPPDPDFSDTPIAITLPADRTTFELPPFYTVNDDNIDEDKQSFAIVAEIGPDVPENISVAFRLLWERQTALDDEEQLKLGSLTMTVSECAHVQYAI